MNEDLKWAVKEIQRTIIVMQKSVWSVPELALILDISEGRVRHLAAKNVIPSYKQNGSIYFKRAEIESWQTRFRRSSADEINAKAATYCATHRLKH